MIRSLLRLGSWLFIAFVVINITMCVITNVPTQVTSSDVSIFRSILSLDQPKDIMSYDQEIALISKVQRQILSEAPVGEAIPEYADREPADLFRQKSGLCYDRSRTYDKVFSWLGFDVRHVYILYPEHPVTKLRLPYWKAFFIRGTNSHAVTEVKTTRGWLVVDSNSAWISVTKDGAPLDADHLHESASSFVDIPDYFNRPYVAIRGLYSRRGQQYRPYIPYPELNWGDFWSWILGLD